MLRQRSRLKMYNWKHRFLVRRRKMSYSLICLRMATAVVVSGFSVVLPGFGTALPLPANVLRKDSVQSSIHHQTL